MENKPHITTIDDLENALNRGGRFRLLQQQKDTLLARAAEIGRVDLVQFLVKRGASYDNYAYVESAPILLAIEHGHIDVVKYFAKIDKRHILCDDYHLKYAAYFGWIDIVKYIVQLGSEINENYIGGYPVHWAIWGGHLPIVQYLVEHGADIFQYNEDDGEQAIHTAARHGQLNIIKYLLEHGASINDYTKEKMRPIDVAHQYQHSDIVEFLLSQGSPPPTQ